MWSSRRLSGLVGLAMLGAASGCVETSLREAREPMDYAPVIAAPVSQPTEGGIYPGDEATGTGLFWDNKAHRVGDLVTVMIVEDTQAKGVAKTETTSDRKIGATLSSDVGLQKLVSSPIRGLMRMLGFDKPGTTIAEGSTLNFLTNETKNEYKGDGTTSRSGTFSGVITCRVLDTLPNGVLHIRGRRSVVVNHEAQYIALEGLVRSEDLSINNLVLSSAIADMRLSYDGLGTVDDKQRPGWLARAMDWIYPF